MPWIEDGDPHSPLYIVGEAPGGDEVQSGRPFTGASGQLLEGCLREAGLSRGDCYLTNTCHERPPSYTDKKGKTVHNDIEQFFVSATAARGRSDATAINGRYALPPITAGLARLTEQIGLYRPRVIILLGNTPLWGLARESGITKWRGSTFQFGAGGTALVAAFHPADCLPNRSPQHRPLLVHDLERAKRVLADPTLAQPPQWDFTIPTSIEDIEEWIQSTDPATPLACDIETRAMQIACIGLASSASRAICIPFMRSTPMEYGHSYWGYEAECSLLLLLRKVLRERPLTFHNGLFDCQYIVKQWGFMPWHADDTMAMQHVAFPGFLGGKIDPVTGRVDKRGSSLSLSFIASLYCRQYRFWKDDGRQWDADIHDEVQYWRYNCEDCCRTWECRQSLTGILSGAKLGDQYALIMQTLRPIYKMMWRGFAVDRDAMLDMYAGCDDGMDSDRRWLAVATGISDINPASNPQMVQLFYRDLQQPTIYKGRGESRTATCDDDALTKMQRRTPLLRPLCERIQHYRSMETIRKDCDVRSLSKDGRLRTALNPNYVETFRLSSNETAFGEGCVRPTAEALTRNGWQQLQNIRDGEYILQWDIDTHILQFERCSIRSYHADKMMRLRSEQIGLVSTLGHRIARKTLQKDKNYQVSTAALTASRSSSYLPLGGIFAADTIGQQYPSFLPMLMADFSREGNVWRGSFKKERKIERFLALAREFDFVFTEQKSPEGYRRFYIQGYHDLPKKWGPWVLGLYPSTGITLLDEARHWDAHDRGSGFIFYSASREQAEWFQILAHLFGKSATLRKTEQSEGSYSDTTTWCVNVKNRDYCQIMEKHWSYAPYRGEVMCPVVPSSFWLVRDDGFVSVTGNSNLQNMKRPE